MHLWLATHKLQDDQWVQALGWEGRMPQQVLCFLFLCKGFFLSSKPRSWHTQGFGGPQ